MLFLGFSSPLNTFLGAADDVTSSIIARSSKKSRPSAQPRRRITPVTLDSTGRPIFPIELGSLTVYSLGEVCDVNDTEFVSS